MNIRTSHLSRTCSMPNLTPCWMFFELQVAKERRSKHPSHHDPIHDQVRATIMSWNIIRRVRVSFINYPIAYLFLFLFLLFLFYDWCAIGGDISIEDSDFSLHGPISWHSEYFIFFPLGIVVFMKRNVVAIGVFFYNYGTGDRTLCHPILCVIILMVTPHSMHLALLISPNHLKDTCQI